MKGDSRFSEFDQINNARYRVAVGEGFAEETFVRGRAPKAQIIAIQSASDTAAPINAVLTGRADIAIVNIEDAKRFLAAHGDRLQSLWTAEPPAYAPAGFCGSLWRSYRRAVPEREPSRPLFYRCYKRHHAKLRRQPGLLGHCFEVI